MLSEIIRVSAMMPNQGFNELDRLRQRSPSPMASSNLLSNVAGAGLTGWNGLPQEVVSFLILWLLSCYLIIHIQLMQWYCTKKETAIAWSGISVVYLEYGPLGSGMVEASILDDSIRVLFFCQTDARGLEVLMSNGMHEDSIPHAL